jgi:hypothetical protein
MVKPFDWTALQQQVDYVIDGRWAEPVILIPWIAGTKVYTPTEQGPDPTRKLLKTTGIYVSAGAELVGESGSAHAQGNARQVGQKVWLSVTTANIGSVTSWVAGDRVYFPNRDMFYNIDFIGDSATLRPNIYLIREHDITTGEGNPVGQFVPTQANFLYFDTFANRFYRSVSLTPPNFTVNDWVPM